LAAACWQRCLAAARSVAARVSATLIRARARVSSGRRLAQLTVGIGALAGSTIMLLTVPWGLSIYLGSVPVEGASGAQYRKKQSKRGASCGKVLTGFGVTPEPSIQANAKIMLGTALIYLVIQGPAFSYATEPSSAEVMGQLAAVEHPYALAGLVLALLSFVGYIWAMTQQDDGAGSNKEYMINAASIKAIENTSNITLAGIIAPIITQSVSKASEEGGLAYLSGALLDAPGKRRLQDLLKPFFKKFDVNGDGQINTAELRDLLRQLGEEARTAPHSTTQHHTAPHSTTQHHPTPDRPTAISHVVAP
jgi:Ca2+/Na+ antiporter